MSRTETLVTFFKKLDLKISEKVIMDSPFLIYFWGAGCGLPQPVCAPASQ